MTKAGDRILNRRTTAKHIETGYTVVVDNSDIPVTAPHRSHLQQRNIALSRLSNDLGTDVTRDNCKWAFDTPYQNKPE